MHMGKYLQQSYLHVVPFRSSKSSQLLNRTHRFQQSDLTLCDIAFPVSPSFISLGLIKISLQKEEEGEEFIFSKIS